MSTFICPHCGQPHRQEARFCNMTGKPIQAIADVATPTEAMSGITGKLPSNYCLHGRFFILRKVGQGGMAAVYQAVDKSQPGTLWAIKEMSDTALTDPRERDYAVQAFLQEANLLRRLNHPNLPRVIDVFIEGGKYYLVMEFIQGITLQELLSSRSSPFSEAEVLPWAIQLCDVLAYLHSQNPKIIFRDLKPSNIMITDHGRIKLIDFAIVRFFKPGKTKDTMALGTPGYVSPEATGGQTDERSDVYSLCVTLHHLLTLHDPVRTIFNLPPIRSINPTISSEMERIVMCGVQNQREIRWQSVSQMQGELAKLTGDRHRFPGILSRPGDPGIEKVASVPGLAATASSGDPLMGKTVMSNAPKVSTPTEAVHVEPSGGGMSKPVAQPVSPVRTSRPTTRLVISAARLSGRQFTLLVLLAAIGIVVVTWLLAPILDEMPIEWNNVPLVAIFGAFGYALFPRRGMVFVCHTFLSTLLIGTIWLKLDLHHYKWHNLFLGALLSGVFMEIWATFLPKLKGDRGDEAWRREALWLMGMAMIGSAIFFEIVSQGYTGIRAVQLVTSAILGVMGWFLGDFLRQFLLFRRIGIKR